MTKSSRASLRRNNLDFTEFTDKDNRREFKLNKLNSHKRPVDLPIPARPLDTVKDRALTEER